jgi:polar amino acid transport system permease protein
LTRVGWVTVNRIPEGLMVFSLVGLLYFSISYPLIRLSNHLEKKMATQQVML